MVNKSAFDKTIVPKVVWTCKIDNNCYCNNYVLISFNITWFPLMLALIMKNRESVQKLLIKRGFSIFKFIILDFLTVHSVMLSLLLGALTY